MRLGYIKRTKGDQMDIKAWLVKGCGVSVLCYDQGSIIRWVRYMLERGGAPVVEEIKGGQVGYTRVD